MMTRDYYRKELKKLKSELHPDYKLVRIGFGFQSTDRRVPWVLFKAVGSSSSYADMYKQFLITTNDIKP